MQGMKTLFYLLPVILFFESAIANTGTSSGRFLSNSTTSEFQCADGARISSEKLCNGVIDCDDTFNSDECGCSNYDENIRAMCEKWALVQYVFSGETEDALKKTSENRNLYECIMQEKLVNCSSHPGSIQCDTAGLCVIASAFCDNQPCCPDKADEKHIGFGLKCQVEGGLQTRECLLPKAHLHDAEDQCVDGAENCYVLDSDGNRTEQLKSHCFQCINKEHVILADQVCDGILDCSDFSDECLCRSVRTLEICRIMYEESYRPEDECKSGAGDVSCGDGTCISKSLICNNQNDCENGIDEMYCSVVKSQRQQSNYSVPKSTIRCQIRKPEGGLPETIEATMCDEIAECESLEDECVEECFRHDKLAPAFCDLKTDCVPGNMVCNGIRESQTLQGCNYTYVPGEEENCPNRFYCDAANGTLVSIDYSLVCDGVVHCDDGSDESMEAECDKLDGRFYCETTSSLSTMGNESSRSVPYVPRYQVADGKLDCMDGSDECPISQLESQVFHSKTEMIKWTSLRIILWINAIIAITGNLTVLIFSLAKMRHHKKLCSRSAAFTCHHILVFNLSISDLLMGIYLMGVAIASSVNSGRYCSVDRVWRLGTTCQALGVIALVSSEVSVYIMLVMAAFRYVTIKDPLFSRFSNSSINKIRVITISGWIIAIFIAIVPVIHPLTQFFRSQAFVQSPIFMSSEVAFQDVKLIAQKIEIASDRGYISNVNSPGTSTIYAIENTVNQILPIHGRLKWLTVYGKTSVCLPGLFRKILEQSWEYYMSIILFNFIAFCIMIVMYFLLIRATKNSRQSVQSDADSSVEYKLMKRVTAILITDFLCWTPICITFFIYLFGSLTDPLAFAICSVVLLPINSALNPIIYSGLPDILVHLFNAVFRCDDTSKHSHSSSTSLNPIKANKSTQRNIIIE